MTARPDDTVDLVGKIIDYEDGNMSESEVVAFFQELVDSGMAWTLQGHYGRTARVLIEAGRVRLGAPVESAQAMPRRARAEG